MTTKRTADVGVRIEDVDAVLKWEAFDNLSSEDLVRAAGTCREWRAIVQEGLCDRIKSCGGVAWSVALEALRLREWHEVIQQVFGADANSVADMRAEASLALNARRLVSLGRISAAQAAAGTVSLGRGFGVAALADGRLCVWGTLKVRHWNQNDKVLFSHDAPVVLNINDQHARPCRFIRVSCGDDYVLALTDDGAVYSFGSGEDKRLGHKSAEDQCEPKLITRSVNRRIVAIAAAYSSFYALTADGLVLEGMGEFPINCTSSHSTPTRTAI